MSTTVKDTTVTLSEIIISFIESIDLVSFLLKNHHRRTAIIAYQLGTSCNLSPERLQNLVLAASLHDIGALTVTERNALIELDVHNPNPHAILGSVMLEPFRLFKDISKIIRYHHVQYNYGQFKSELGEEAPFESYLLHLADRIEILIKPNEWVLDQIPEIREKIVELSGSLFHPQAVEAFVEFSDIDRFWLDIENLKMEQILKTVITHDQELTLDIVLLEELAYTLSRIIDFRSAFTATHSYGVGCVAFELGRLAGMPSESCRKLRVAGYLHDIGKIAIPTEIIDKPSDLSKSEFNQMKAHAYYTNLILRKIKGLDDICAWASMHHEKHDGTGYPYHIKAAKISREMEILAYADIFTALTEDRPYRKGLDNDLVLQIIRDDFMPKLGEEIYTLVVEHIDELNQFRYLTQMTAMREYQRAIFSANSGIL